MRQPLSTTPRIYYPAVEGDILELSGDRFQHLGKSRRLTVGEEFLTFSGSGEDLKWRVSGIGKTSLKAELIETIPMVNEPSIDLTLAFSPLKGGRTDDVIAKGTQLGVNRFLPFICSRSVSRLSGSKGEGKVLRWRDICEQNSGFSKRTNVPVVENVIGFNELLMFGEYTSRILFYEEENPRAGILKPGLSSPALAVIGPEGGFEADEARDAKSAGFEISSLGVYLLKADTAAIKAINLILG